MAVPTALPMRMAMVAVSVAMSLERISASETEPFLDCREHESLVVKSHSCGTAP